MPIHRSDQMFWPLLALACACFYLAQNALAQKTVKLDRTLAGMTDTSALVLERRPDVFEDYGWLKPDIRSRELQLNEGPVEVLIGDRHVLLERSGDSLSLSIDGRTMVSAIERCSGCYPDLSSLRTKAVQVQQWVPVTTYSMRSVMVTRTRQVTRYQYNSSTHTSQPYYTTESYMTSEYQYQPTTRYQYQTRTSYVLDIPERKVFAFEGVIHANDRYLIYEPLPGAENGYAWQQTSYLVATTPSNIHQVFIDNDGNGNFLDDHDQMVFNTWNPFAKSSSYKGAGRFKGNKWLTHGRLVSESFVEFRFSDDLGHVVCTDLNQGLYDDRDFGLINFEGLPDGSSVAIYGRSFKKVNKGLKCQYGRHLVTINNPGFLPLSKVVKLSKEHPNETLHYELTAPAKELTLMNIFSKNFTVTITNDQGYEANYFNTTVLQVPDGIVHLSIDNEGYVLEKDLDLSMVGSFEFDYVAAIKELLTEEEAPTQEGSTEVPVPEK